MSSPFSTATLPFSKYFYNYKPCKQFCQQLFSVFGIAGFKVEHAPVLDATDPTKVTKKAADEDLMVADYVCQNQDTKKDVDLKFRHALAKVQFLFKTVKTAGVSVYVQKVEIKDLETTGSVTVSYDASTGAASFDWGELPVTGSTTLKSFTDAPPDTNILRLSNVT